MMAEQKLIITIGRQYGSGGREVGEKLSKALGIDVYDKNIIRMNAYESGLKESYFHLNDEKPGNRLLYRIISNLRPEQKSPSFGADLVSADNLFRFQSEVIKKLAEEESCVIIGRCADYILRDRKDLLRIFIYADLDARLARITEKGYFAPADVPKNVRRMDKERQEYYGYYTGWKWGDPAHYDLMINTASLGVDGAVEMIKGYWDARMGS